MRTWSTWYPLTALLVALLVCPPPLVAAVIVVGGSCTLVDAITAANTDTATGGCTAGSGADEIELTGDVTLTAVDNVTDGPNGLPSIESEIAIRSSDGTPRTIERDPGAPLFRVLHVNPTGDLSLERVVVGQGDTDSRGGGIFNRARLALTNTTVSGNSAAGSGGGIFNRRTSNLELTNTTVSGNSAGSGGGISNYSARVTLTNSVVSDNSANGSGGGISNFNGRLTLTDSTVSGNSAGYRGGGIADGYGLLTLINSTVSGNSADSGGGIMSSGGVTLTNSTVSGNSANDSGGGIYGGVRLTNSTVSGNSAGFGGGIHTRYYYGNVDLTNSTISGNSATFYGGGISNLNSNVSLTNSSVSANGAVFGGGGISHFVTYYGSMTLTGSLVGHSPSGGNCAGDPITDGGSNLADDDTCGSIPGSLTGLDPALADNGGPTLTHALLAGSNAIDLAGECGLGTDQRLASRNDGSCDAGSFEFGSVPGEIFADDFESGDTSAWSMTVP